MDVYIHHRIEVLDRLIPKWDKLIADFYEITVFQYLEWMKDWWDYISKNQKITPYIIEVKDGNETIGIFPMYISRKKFAKFHFRVLRPIGYVDSDYLIPIISKKYSAIDILKKAMMSVVEDKENWDSIDWGDIPEKSLLDKFLNNIAANNGAQHMIRKKTDVCPYLVLDKDFEKVKPKIDKQFLGQTLSKERKMNRNGQLNFYMVKSPQEMEEIMQQLFKLHCKRWGNTNTPSRFECENERNYTLQVAKNLYHSNLLHLTYLTYNKKVVSVHFGMTDGKKVYFYTPAFDINFKKYSVGSILMYYLIRISCQEGYGEFDFMRGNENYKRLWGTSERFNVRYIAFNNNIRSLLFKFIRNTYYNSEFDKKPIVLQVGIKIFIRATTMIFSVYHKLITKKDVLVVK